MREVDALKVAFVEHDSYFAGFHTPSMYSTAKRTGADIVLLLAEGKTEADISDDEIRALVEGVKTMKALIAKLTQPDTLRLHLGELDANELRIAQAAVRYALSQLQSLAFIGSVSV